MTEDSKHEPDQNMHAPRPEGAPIAQTHEIRRLPGLAAIGLYMLLLAGTVILGVAMKQFPRLYLAFPVLFVAAGLGLLMMFRWAWALTLAAVVMLMALFLYEFATLHAGFALVQGLLNMVFFLYLVRAEVREKLR